MIVFYTNKFIPKNKDACARGFLIFIRPQFRENRGLLEHEKVHVRQWLRTFGMHSLLYAFSQKYRDKAEQEAIAVQEKYK